MSDLRKGEYVSFEEKMREFEFARVDLGTTRDRLVGMGIVKLPDLDGEGVWLPQLPALERGEGNEGFVVERLKQLGARVTEVGLTDEQKARLAGRLEAGWPILGAVTTIDRESGVEMKGTVPKVIYNVVSSEGGWGKSAILAGISWRLGMPCYTLDKFSRKTHGLYVRYFEHVGLGKEASAKEMLGAIGECRETRWGQEGKAPELLPLRETVTEIVRGVGKQEDGITWVEATAGDSEKKLKTHAYTLAAMATEGSIYLDVPGGMGMMDQPGELKMAMNGDDLIRPIDRPQYRVTRISRELEPVVLERVLDQLGDDVFRGRMYRRAVEFREQFAEAVRNR